MQLERQSELHQQLYTEFDRQYYKAQSQAAKIVGLDDTDVALAEASEFLVNQMKLLQEETEDLNHDNQELRRNYDELGSELNKLATEKQYYESCFDSNNYPDENVFRAVQSIKSRIEELYDLGEDLKTYSTKQEVNTLQDLRLFSSERVKRLRETTNARLTNRIESIIKTGQTEEKEEHTVEFFAKLLSEKERKIQNMSSTFEKEQQESKQMQSEIEQLRGKIEGLDIMCYGKLKLIRHSGRSTKDQRDRLFKSRKGDRRVCSQRTGHCQ